MTNQIAHTFWVVLEDGSEESWTTDRDLRGALGDLAERLRFIPNYKKRPPQGHHPGPAWRRLRHRDHLMSLTEYTELSEFMAKSKICAHDHVHSQDGRQLRRAYERSKRGKRERVKVESKGFG